MFKTKKEVDKHVETLLSKLSVKEFKTRAYSIARLYFEVGDYSSCQKYVEQYITQKDNNAAAHKLLGQALQKLGQKEKALEQFKISLDIDPTQTSTVLDICELLADDEVIIDPGRAKYWCEKAEATFPRHSVTFRLREKLITMTNPDPEALVKLLTAEISARPKDTILHIRLLKHYLLTNQIKEAFEHCCDIEFSSHTFNNNFTWYETLTEVLKHKQNKHNDWLHQLLLLTVKERVCVLSLTETPTGTTKSLSESSELLHAYDLAIEQVAKAGPSTGHSEFHSSLLQHHRGQFVFHGATFLLKKAKKDQLSWRDAVRHAAPLMLMSWQTVPLDAKVNWLAHAPEKQKSAVHHWYKEGTYRCSQAGHYLLSNVHDKSQTFMDKISQSCSGAHWKDKLYEKLFPNRDHLAKIGSSHFVSNAYGNPILRLPRKVEVEAYDCDAQKMYANSLHHFVWTLSNYKNYAQFNCTLFDMLKPTISNFGPETLSKIDIYAFLYCATLTSQQQKQAEGTYIPSEKPKILPANITDLLCSLSQMKWWDCAYKFSQNELGTELTNIRLTLSRGIEVVRCIDNHGLDSILLCMLGKVFSEKATMTTSTEEKSNYVTRAALYYSSAIPQLEKLKNKVVIKMPEKRMFDYTHKELNSKEINSLLEESKLYVALNHFNENEYEKVIELLSNLKSAQAYYYLGQTYKRIALEDQNSSGDNNSSTDIKSKHALLSKAKTFAYKALDRIKETENFKSHSLYLDAQQLIEDMETTISKFDINSFGVAIGDEARYSSEENLSAASEFISIRNRHPLRNVSSTPKNNKNATTVTNYRTALDSHLLENTRIDQHHLERIENQLISFQSKFTDDFVAQAKTWFEENQKLGNKIMNTIQSDILNTNDQFKLLKISVDHVKDQLDACRNECKDVGELKKQIADLKKEVNKLKKSSSEQTIDESDLYNLEDDYRTNDSTSSFATQLPFQAPQVMPQFNQRLVPPFSVPPNPYQLYNQNLYNLYNQYSQFAQASAASAAPPLFDPTRPPVNYTGVYPTPDQMYLDIAHLGATSAAAPIPNLPSVPISVPIPPPITTAQPSITKPDSNELARSLPVNVVITSSDPLPTTSSGPAPVLSVTIPPKHIKGTPHNYQIPMPLATDTKATSPPVFSFPVKQGNKSATTSTSSPFSNWQSQSPFKISQTGITSTTDPTSNNFFSSKVNDSIEKSFADGAFLGSNNTSLNKSRTLSERSNTSVENYDPCPDFKPIIPLPAEVKVTTGEEDETAIFSARAKLFRFADKQWKERGIGEMKLLQHKTTKKVRVLMRREQIHKICANHIITSEMEIQPMKNENKAYFWVANDFADETVVLEKFCIRFKTADVAKQFYDTFQTACKESKVSIKTTPKIQTNVIDAAGVTQVVSTPKTSVSAPSLPTKTEFGGFTFSSSPTFKSVKEDKKEEASAEPVTSKANVFSSLSFKPANSSPFANLFTTPSQTNTSSQVQKEETPTKLNSSDAVEEYEPNVEFKPVVPLPALVDQKTGEEDESVLFEHRAKLLRYDAATKEWKERGLGNIKLLVNKKSNQKVRLLMRREQIMKICCNHAVTKDMVFQKKANMDKAVTWCAKDFSEGELLTETFCIRFKTVEACDSFLEALKNVQSMLKDESKAAKEEQNAAKQTTTTGFGEKFKPKAGSWCCDACYTNNLEDYNKCACCEQPRPNVAAPAVSTPTATKSTPSAANTNWGDKFKPKPGSWECNACLIRNEAGVDYCTACNSPKDPSMPKKDASLASSNSKPLQFNFGIPAQTTTPSNNNAFVTITSGPKFNFGIPQTTAEEKPKVETASMFDGTGGHKFKFGIPATTTDSKDKSSIAFGEQKSATFTPNIGAVINSTIEKSLANNGSQSKLETPVKSGSLPASKESNVFGAKDAGTFDFVFKPKPQQKGKSPIKSPKGHGDESDDNEYASEDEGHHIHFSPVVPLPDKVDVVTGEENEEELYGHRSRLYRFVSGEWKERGIGVIKVLKHNDTGKLRIVMRREQVLKICLNHALSAEITYKPKDERSWLFAANDFSEGELNLQQFCIRFKSKEIALEFKEAIDKALRGDSKPALDTGKPDDSDDVVFVNEILATPEEKLKAAELMLPENFFTYKNKPPCPGCRGCKDNENTAPAAPVPPIIKASIIKPPPDVCTPLKNSGAADSFYGTPSNFEKTVDFSLFRTPLGSIVSNQNSISPAVTSSFASPIDTTDKENTLTDNNSDYGLFSQTSILSTPHKTDDSKTKSSLLIASESNSSTTLSTEKPNENKYIFGSTASGFSSNKSIFGGATEVSAKPEVKSIFGGDNDKPVNLFSNAVQGSIFGPGALNNNQQKPSIFGSGFTFGSNATQAPTFGGAGLFGNVASQAPSQLFGTNVEKSQNNDTKNPAEAQDAPLKLDNSLSFAALSSQAVDFSVQKKADFQWEGAGQQLFGAKAKGGNKSKNDSNDGEDVNVTGENEEYDPHYEPIVPLPDKIVVTTGEEDEEKIFGDRCKLYRYDEKTREWKERGVGEMKILYHPERNTYRLLLRREQVHKAVLNMLLYMDLELLPMKNSDRAWTWAGRNFAENPEGEQETLAVRFKSVDLATLFRDKTTECVRKMQAAAAQAIQEEREPKQAFSGVAPLRLPKHLEVSARADGALSAKTAELSEQDRTNGVKQDTRQVHFQVEQSHEEEDDDEDDDEDYDQEDYDAYYNEEDEESAAHYSCEGEAVISQGDTHSTCDRAHIQVLYDQDILSPKIQVTDSDTGEILADMVIYTDTDFQLTGDSCTWSGLDYTTNVAVDKTVTINFYDGDTAMLFYDACETSKAATYSSTDPET